MALETFIERYAGGFPVRVAWRCEGGVPCEAALDAPAIAMAADVSERLRGHAAIHSVRSPSHASILVPSAEGFDVERLIDFEGSPAERADRVRRAQEDPYWLDQLVSRDGLTGALLVQPVDTESGTSIAVVEAIRSALDPWEAQGFRFNLVGHPVEFVVAGRELAESTAALTPVTAAAVALLLFLLTSSWQAVLGSMATMGVALVWTFGMLGALDWPQDSILQVLAPLVLVTGVCDAVHLVSQTRAAAGASRAERARALERAARDVEGPCFVTTLTTGVALLSFATSDLATFVRFGVVASFGVVTCLFLTFVLLPVLLAALPAGGDRAHRADALWAAGLEGLTRLADRQRRMILVCAALLMVLCAIGWADRLRVDTDGYEMYGEQSQVIRWIRFVERHLARADTLELDIALPDGVAIEQPEQLRRIADLGRALSGVEGMGRAHHIVHAVARVRRVIHDDAPEAERVGTTAAENAELIELLSFEDPDFVSGWLGFERRHVRLSVDAEFQSFATRSDTLDEIGRVIERKLPAGYEVTATGPFAMGRDWVRDVQSTQLRSFGAALIGVFALLWIYTRSLGWALLALAPTLLPVVGILGGMGWLGLSLDVGRAMIAAVVLGIGIDDTVHLLSRFRRERRAGVDAGAAIEAAVHGIGRPVVTTSLALALGFLALAASSWQTVSSFGLFVSLGIGGALVADLLVLPALVLAVESRR